MNWVRSRVHEQSHYVVASIGNTEFTGLVLADDATIFLASLVMALVALDEEVKPLALD